MLSVEGLPCSDASPAREVAERFGYSLSPVYNMTRDFRQPDDPAALFFRDPVPRGRPAVRPAPRLRQRIVALRKRNLSVPDIRAWLDAEEPRSPSERVIENVLKDEGFQCESAAGVLCLLP